MRLLRNFSGRLVVVFLVVVSTRLSWAADKNAFEWLRGSGSELEMRLRGEVFAADGEPAKEVEVAGFLNSRNGKLPLEPTIDGHHFEIWIPVNGSNWYSLALTARSKRNGSVAYLAIDTSKLRQRAIDGVKLTLKNPSRRVEVKVIDKGQPVKGATVKLEHGYGIESQSRTNELGIAHFKVLPDRELSHLTVWTDDFRIGGYGFGRGPARDPAVNEHVMELSACRDQKLRFIDQGGAPVVGIGFFLQMATPPPDYNYIGTHPNSEMTTDSNGEAIDKWFPDWERHHFYPELRTNLWVLDGNFNENHQLVDGVVVFKLKKTRIAERQRVTGQVKSNRSRVGGFYVTFDSFNGEQKNHRDVLGTFANGDGSFVLDVLPDATYCAYVIDDRLVGEIIDLIPYESEGGRINPPTLTVSQGQKVEVFVTSGVAERPYANLDLSFRRDHSLKFREDGKMRHGTSGSQWWATTDESGRAETQTLPGELTVSVYTPLWRTEEKVKVKAGQPVQVHLHREVDEKQLVTGRLAPPEGVQVNWKEVEIKVGSVDGATQELHRPICDGDGRFTFETLASRFGIFATTKDGRWTGVAIVEHLGEPIQLPLVPAVDFQGMLVSESGEPVAGQKIQALARVEGKHSMARAQFLTHFEVKNVETTTDESGKFTLKSLPTSVKINLLTVAADDSSQNRHLEEIVLQPNEARSREVYRLARSSSSQQVVLLAKKYRATLRDCALSGYRPLVIIAHEEPSTTAFIEKYLRDHESNSDIYGFMQIMVAGHTADPDSEDGAFLKEQNWRQPGKGQVLAYAFDSQGHPVGELAVNIADKDAGSTATAFVHEHAPPKTDAQKKWDEAFAEAKRTNRRVWARVSQRYCGPCFRLTRWLDDQRELLEKDFVMLKIDDFRDQNGQQVADRLTLGAHHGVPFSAIFDTSGELLADSAGPVGNVGFPSGFAGKKQLRQMLLKSKINLSDADVEKLVESIDSPTRDANDR